jgi:hypothetical protein
MTCPHARRSSPSRGSGWLRFEAGDNVFSGRSEVPIGKGMWFRKKKNRERHDDEPESKGYNDVLSDRLSRIGDYTHDYDESERDEVEARIRRMFYGAKVEGSLSDRTSEADDTDTESESYGNAANG